MELSADNFGVAKTWRVFSNCHPSPTVCTLFARVYECSAQLCKRTSLFISWEQTFDMSKTPGIEGEGDIQVL